MSSKSPSQAPTVSELLHSDPTWKTLVLVHYMNKTEIWVLVSHLTATRHQHWSVLGWWTHFSSFLSNFHLHKHTFASPAALPASPKLISSLYLHICWTSFYPLTAAGSLSLKSWHLLSFPDALGVILTKADGCSIDFFTWASIIRKSLHSIRRSRNFQGVIQIILRWITKLEYRRLNHG